MDAMTYSYAIEQFLGAVAPFKGLPRAARQELAGVSVERHFQKGETVFREGQPSQSIWVLKSGRVHLVHHLVSGRLSTTCMIVPNELFCCLPALDQQAYPATAIAAEASVVVQIPTARVHALMAQQPAFTERVLCTVCERIRQIEFTGCRAQDPVEQRVAQALLTLQKKFGTTLPLTRQELADLVGTTVETTIRTLSHFQRKGWLRSGRGKIELLKPAALQQFLQ